MSDSSNCAHPNWMKDVEGCLLWRGAEIFFSVGRKLLFRELSVSECYLCHSHVKRYPKMHRRVGYMCPSSYRHRMNCGAFTISLHMAIWENNCKLALGYNYGSPSYFIGTEKWVVVVQKFGSFPLLLTCPK